MLPHNKYIITMSGGLTEWLRSPLGKRVRLFAPWVRVPCPPPKLLIKKRNMMDKNISKRTALSAFDSAVFNFKEMEKRLPKVVFSSLKKTIINGNDLDPKIADDVAEAMKNWALEKGVTHYTHWFQPMTGITAEKHEAFIAFDKNDNLILNFSGKELVKGEPDASSFPTGGVRSTFEARGYTAWDPTSFAFIKDDVLCIPTAFCSYSGESLDKKTPLLRSMQVLSKEGKKILKLFDNKDNIKVNVGAEQEYFLIDEDIFLSRKDLIYTGRTLFGAMPSKGQELDDHYFGTIKPIVLDFMKELDEELWKLGISSKTRHNEVAPAQHEIAVIYEDANVATDHNQLIMETLKNVAKRHSLTCLLHEKPFKGVNGSGKHCNWSIGTSGGENLLDPGKTPKDNTRFLLFLAAVIKAVDDHQDLLRIAIGSAGNDHRLGAAEAPPATISIFLGDELNDIIETIVTGKDKSKNLIKSLSIGASVLPNLPKDSTDRNRTSPFAFTGNKFEFRMVGSSSSISAPIFILNAIIADTLNQFHKTLTSSKDFNGALSKLIKDTFTKHKRIIFNGNNYSPEWKKEAKKRGLLNLETTPDALSLFDNKKNIDLFKRTEILCAKEIKSRKDLLLEEYWKLIKIEALTMRNLTRKEFIPTALDYCANLSNALISKVNAKKIVKSLSINLEKDILSKISSLSTKLQDTLHLLEKALKNAPKSDNEKIAFHYVRNVLPAMENLRTVVDELELLTDKSYWPVPSYGEILYSVK